MDAGRLARTLAHVDARWLVVAVCCNLLIQPCGAMQWRAFLPDVRLVAPKRMLRFFALTSVANNTTPSLIGHATGVLLLASEPGMTRGMALSRLDNTWVPALGRLFARMGGPGSTTTQRAAVW